MEPRASPASRRGFGLVEVVVLIGIVAVLGVIGLAAMVQMSRLERIQQTAQILTDIGMSMNNSGPGPAAFQQSTGNNPGRLHHLVFPITGSDENSCGNGYGTPQVKNWPDAAPYSRIAIDSMVGLPTPIGIGNDLLVRTPAGGGGPSGNLAIVFNTVDSVDVRMLDDYMDDGDGDLGGFIRWSPVAGSTTTMTYNITIDRKC